MPRWFRAGLAAIALVSLPGAVILGLWTRAAAPVGAHDTTGVAEDAPSATAGGAPATAEVLARGRGEHALRGALVDVGGAPVAGAEVAARADDAPDDAPPTAVARTGADGTFELAGLDAGTHRVLVSGAGVFDATARFVDVPGDDLRLVVTRKAELRGRVTRAGRASPGAEVIAASVDGVDRRRTAAGADGHFAFSELAAGRYRVLAVRGAAGSVAREIDLPSSAPIEIELAPATIVEGRVVDRRGEGLVADVSLVAERDGEPPRRTRTDPSGRFRFEGVTEGRWTPSARRPGYVAGESLSFDAARVRDVELVLGRGAVVRGQVVDAAGVGVAGAAVTLLGVDVGAQPVAVSAMTARRSSVGAPGSSGGLRLLDRGELGVTVGAVPALPPPGVRTARAEPTDRPADADAPKPLPIEPDLEPLLVTDGRGRFRFTGLRAGRYQVRALRDGYAPRTGAEFTVAAGAERDGVRVVLLGGTVVHGVVSDGRGPVAGATVSARAGDQLLAVTVSDGDGRYELSALLGEVELSVNAPRRATEVRRISLGRERAPARRRIDLELARADSSIRGRVLDHGGFDIGGARIEVVGRRDRSATSASAGQFEITGLPEGSYDLRADANGYPAIVVSARTGAPATIQLRLGGGIDVQALDRHTRSLLGEGVATASGPGGARVKASIENGRAELVPLAVGRWTVEVSSDGYVSHKVAVDVPAARLPGQTSVDRQVELARGATLAGVVRDRYGQRVAGASVEVAGATARTDVDGAFRLENVPVGDVVLEARKGEDRGSEPLSLRPGDEIVTLDIRFD